MLHGRLEKGWNSGHLSSPMLSWLSRGHGNPALVTTGGFLPKRPQS